MPDHLVRGSHGPETLGRKEKTPVNAGVFVCANHGRLIEFRHMQSFGVDRNGYIVTEVSAKKIPPVFKPAVTYVLATVVKKYAKYLDGAYLYGSIVTGKAVKGVSDMDVLLILKRAQDTKFSASIADLEKVLSKKYASLLRGVGLGVTNVKEVRSPKEKYGLLCYVKHLCVCLYGNDITKDVPKFKPTKAVAKGFNGDIAKKISVYRGKLLKRLTPAQTKKVTQEVSKKIVRTGFSLVMPRSRSWTTSLQKSFEVFAYYYPGRSCEMSQALQWSKSGTVDKRAVIDFIDTSGRWLAREIKLRILS